MVYDGATAVTFWLGNKRSFLSYRTLFWFFNYYHTKKEKLRWVFTLYKNLKKNLKFLVTYKYFGIIRIRFSLDSNFECVSNLCWNLSRFWLKFRFITMYKLSQDFRQWLELAPQKYCCCDDFLHFELIPLWVQTINMNFCIRTFIWYS